MELANRSTEFAGSNGGLAESLRQLGFTDYEAQAYLALTQSHPATAYEVAKLSGLPRANVYSVLRQLEMKGAIQPVTENPVRYAPHDPEEFFGRYAQTTSTLCRDVARQVKARSRPSERTYVWYYEGQEDVHDKVRGLINEARESVWIKAPDHLIKPYLADLKHAAEQGVQVILVVYGRNVSALKVHPRMQVMPHEGDGIGRGASDVLFTMSTDFSGVIIATHHPAEGVNASYARNRAIVYVVQTLFLHEFYIAEMYAKLGPMLDETFGKELAKLRKKYRPAGMERRVLDGI